MTKSPTYERDESSRLATNPSAQLDAPVLLVRPWTGVQDNQQSTLKLWGFRSSVTSDGEEALRMIVEQGCRALVLDLDLPQFDTLAMVGALRGHPTTAHIPIVAYSASLSDEVLELAYQRGCTSVLEGPVDPDILAMEVEAALARPCRGRSLFPEPQGLQEESDRRAAQAQDSSSSSATPERSPFSDAVTIPDSAAA